MNADQLGEFLFTGGGTGGHVIPALAVARELRARGHSVRFIGTERGLEARLVPAEKFPIQWIEIGGLKRVGLRQSLVTLAELPWSVWQASRIIDRIRPAAVFSTGGYVAGPVLLAALWKRIPAVILEPNAVPGFTHRKLKHFVAHALVSFEETARWFPEGRSEVTGVPVREEFFAIPASAPPKRGAKLTVVITGGSQGSRTLNRAVEESWTLWKKGSVRLIHQTGPAEHADLTKRFCSARSSPIGVSHELAVEMVPFFANMAEVFAQADVVVSRAGMGAVSELAASGRPSILVPLPTASDQHQLRNAEAMARAGAAIVILDRDMNGARLVEEVAQLTAEPGRLQEMGAAARAFSKPDAARRAAEILESFVKPIDKQV